MAKLSVVIPSRDEKFIISTIDDIFRNARGEIEVVAVLDSNVWPEGWKEVTERHANLHTIHNGGTLGMRASINRGVASAISRGATYIAKSDGHCAFSEGFDEELKGSMDDDWVVVPRRLRLDPEAWTIAEPQKPPYDYHYLSFPDDPNDFGGPGLNGKPWVERQQARRDVLLDEEMSSQGSFWTMKAAYFEQLELMDEASYGPFWNEFQEIGLKCWLSGGKVMVNKRCHYAHLHKGKKYGRGYRLEESALVIGRNHTMKWIWNEAWDKQTKPFEWLIDHFWPVPGWREDWREVLYANRKPKMVAVGGGAVAGSDSVLAGSREVTNTTSNGLLFLLWARYGVGFDNPDQYVNVLSVLQDKVRNNSLDIVVTNHELGVGNPFRGKKKRLQVAYRYGATGEKVVVERDEKDWLIIGQVRRLSGPRVEKTNSTDDELHRDGEQGTVIDTGKVIVQWDDGQVSGALSPDKVKPVDELRHLTSYSGNRAVDAVIQLNPPRTATALNDYLIRKFSISPQRLRAPMPIELRDFHRNDLAQLFAELGFTKGCEVGVAEGKFSQVLLEANPKLELHMVDPWHGYSDNPQNKSKQKHEFAYQETLRRTQGYKMAIPIMEESMEYVRQVVDDSLDFAYIDGNHLFDYVMQDLIEWSKRVRSGGIVSGDDYYHLDQKRWVGGGVVEAVNAYVNAHCIPVWFTCSGHKSYDYFWVKP